MPTWTFLSNHALVLLTIANDPGIRLRDIGDQVGITERAAHRIVTELDEGGYLVREREGRRNRYTISGELGRPRGAGESDRPRRSRALLGQARRPGPHRRRRPLGPGAGERAERIRLAAMPFVLG